MKRPTYFRKGGPFTFVVLLRRLRILKVKSRILLRYRDCHVTLKLPPLISFWPVGIQIKVENNSSPAKDNVKIKADSFTLHGIAKVSNLA